MADRVIFVTGAAGFLGSALTVDLAQDNTLVAVDLREPSPALRAAAPSATWHRLDIADQVALAGAMSDAQQRWGRVDLVIHLAAYYHFGSDWREEYQRTNIQGTSSVLEAAMGVDAGRLIFASSMATMLPHLAGEMLTERSPTSHYIPYGKSKSLGEDLVREASSRLPAITLRIGGVFSDWCELPPLCSMMRMWGGGFPGKKRIVVGHGRTGMPYIHRDDLVKLVRRCIERAQTLEAYEVFLASQHGAVSHEELFHVLQETRGDRRSKPIFIPARAARLGLRMERMWGFLTGNPPFEQLWMLEYVDRPWVADTTHSQVRLGWQCSEELSLCRRLPLLCRRFRKQRSEWERRNRARDQLAYAYVPDAIVEGESASQITAR